MRSCKRATQAAVLLAAVLVLLTGTGETSTAVGVAPSRLAFDLEPAECRGFTLDYYNDGDETIAVRVYPMDYLRRADGAVVYAEPSGPLSGAGWIRVDPAAFAAPPRSRTAIGVTVEVPDDVPDGEYHAVVFMEASAPGEGALRVAARVGAVLYMAVGRDLVRAAALVPYGRANRAFGPPPGFLPRLFHLAREYLRAFTVGARHVPVLVTGRPFLVFVPIANLGTIHIRPEVTVRVARGAGEPRTLHHAGEVILAGHAGVIELRWPDPPFLGVVRVQVEVDYGGPDLLRGAATALVFPLDLVAGLLLVAGGLRLLGVRGISIRFEPRRARGTGGRAPPG